MIIKCSKCPAKFKINEDKIKSTEISFKCTKCGSLNTVKKPDISAKEEVKKIPKPIGFQAEKGTRPQEKEIKTKGVGYRSKQVVKEDHKIIEDKKAKTKKLGIIFTIIIVIVAAVSLVGVFTKDLIITSLKLDRTQKEVQPYTDNKHQGQSRFLTELKEHKFTETEAPITTPVFRWDFSNEEIHSYAYEQEVVFKSQMGATPAGDPLVSEQNVSTQGVLLIKSQGDGNAELVLKDLKMNTKIVLKNNEEPETMEQTIPPVVVQGMKEDSSSSFGDSPQETLLKWLFPLPPNSLRVGESVDVPSQMPFNAMGSLLQVKGRSRITLARYVKDGNRTLAQFDVDIDISDLEVPSEMKGKYNCATKGKSVFFFDIVKRRFVSGTVAMLLQFSIDAPTPKMNIDGKKGGDFPKNVKMSMMSDNFIEVSLME
jgi:predicted Zn finger-like uncharacterized protein